MSLPRLIVSTPGPNHEGRLLVLAPDQARHLHALRMKPGAALELLLEDGPWQADLTGIARDAAQVRLISPLQEVREAPVDIHACLPITTHLATWEDWLPPLVELGATHIHPIIYARSEFDARRTLGKAERWSRLISSAVEQSHRSRIPKLFPAQPFEFLLECNIPQRWVAYEAATDTANPALGLEALAFTCGPEGGIADREIAALRGAGWQPVCLGRSILRAATAPIAMLGAIQFQLNR
ncbi:MAG: 16S rRNA (uracil(1498)-N(3))-methyltransferase [Holophagaceae bacterium]|nr:16S rRNA (uracil(1498)-N(3))-methyltransferase [Holophagaceae bacterium]